MARALEDLGATPLVARRPEDLEPAARIILPGVGSFPAGMSALAERGLDAIEVFHSDHAADAQAHYQRVASRLNLLVSGGSDFHGEDASKPGRPQRSRLGVVVLPPAHFAALEDRARRLRGGGTA